MKRFYYATLLLSAIVMAGCQTTPTEIEPDLSQAELIQLAQEAADAENWNTAIVYYEELVERYPNDRASVATARYEIAFIEYKQNDLETARAGFEQVIGMYDFESEALPEWPLVLSQVLLQKMELESNEEAEEETTEAE
ncbi:MAG: tetratricopeptide repeat protein [Spirochaetales bacterium]